MRRISLNGIAKSYLGKRNLSLHYYIRVLKHSSDCLRELLFDTLQVTNTVRLPVDENGEADVPSDCMDICLVGVKAGQYVRPLVRKSSLNKLPNLSDTGIQSTYQDVALDDNFSSVVNWRGIHYNDNGENIGGYFGLGAGSEPDGFLYIPERNKIKVSELLGIDTIVLEYLGDSSYLNAATQIHPYAQSTIEAYVDWQRSPNATKILSQEGHTFTNASRILKRRMSPLSPELIERIINRSRKASIH